ncbi:MAG: hypothetical protein ABJA98_11045 [Acidobacteriota bacterium]
MVKRKPLTSQWHTLLDNAAVPPSDSLPAAIPAERRDAPRRHALLRRIHGEFEEMPGMALTLSQAATLFGLAPEVTSRILHGLEDARVLRLKKDGRFCLRGD